MKTASYWIERYNLLPHPEGGYFAETYRSAEGISQEALPDRFSGNRAFSTGIYFLLESHHFSALHRIHSDEMWHFYAGDPLDIFVMYPETGDLQIIQLGPDPELGQTFQAVVPAGTWFGSRTAPGGRFSLVGCTVAPGFDFADFEMGSREFLSEEFPQHHALIQELTHS
ncbi:hypothetical protein DYBT9275_04538 [Dyadobacter sp. CECT 9275]|uniref:DUF985 domain-containing protein n=1 Tax=Dyadobacter helix TaxID=2822344 RepID=A0A916NMY9_9BACT|nr:cupin domain-containing protein [Dyadobacter sp. CECT 9275]CAG5009628.1 hypothetical protein DYBT9275_04538 [Dyadobacter sp. CECT 9275]